MPLAMVSPTAVPTQPRFALLKPEDAAELLAFEVAERAWFERYVEARDPRFYCPQGAVKHIIECLSLHAQNRMLPLLIRCREGRLIGRANLKQIDQTRGTAQVGYRLARNACGRGIAQKALRHLLKEARCTYGLHHLSAYASVENPASQRVLEKAGFKARQKLPGHSLVAGQRLDCWAYQCKLG